MNTIDWLFVIAGLFILARSLYYKQTQKPTASSTPPAPGTPPPATSITGTSYTELKKKKSRAEAGLPLLMLFLAYVIYRIIVDTSRFIAWIEEVFSGFSWWWITIIVVVIGGLIAFDRFGVKKNTEWQKHWKAWRGKMGFAVLWATIILIINIVLQHLDSGFWSAIWNYKGQGTWFFYLVMGLLTVGIWLAVNMEDDQKKIKVCGKILFGVGMLTWIVVWVKTPPSPNAPPMDQVPASATAIVESRGPSSRWSDAHTFKVKRVEWSPRLSPKLYEAEEGNVEIMLDGNPSDILYWTVRSASSNVVQIKVPAHVKFIQLRSTEKDTIVYGTPTS